MVRVALLFCLTLCILLAGAGVLAQVDSRDVLVGTKLTAGFDMGVNTSEGRHDWLEKNTDEGYFKLGYPSGQSWGVVFITVGRPTLPPRPSKDLSGYQTLSIEMKAEAGTKVIDIGIKTNAQPDDGSETKIPVKLVADWKTYELPLKRFEGTDLRNLYVVAEFVFADSNAQTVYVRNIKYLTRPAKIGD
jgi:hypothetical protein